MEERQPDEQFEHDLAVEAAAAQFASSVKYSIHVNPGEERRTAVGHLYPDLVISDKGSDRVRFVMEVETAGSVVTEEAKQWQEFARLGVPLYLVVPWRVLPIAERLCADAGVRCRFGYYTQDDAGRFKIVLKKD